jgi:hypothetical protein
MIYQDIYQAWKDQDDYDKTVSQLRLAMHSGVIAQRKEGVIDDVTADKLKNVCAKVDILFFYPVVVRVRICDIAPNRIDKTGSGLKGSSECLIRDLDELEIDELLFLDFEGEPDFDLLIRREYDSFRLNHARSVAPAEALAILENRSAASGAQRPVHVP